MTGLCLISQGAASGRMSFIKRDFRLSLLELNKNSIATITGSEGHEGAVTQMTCVQTDRQHWTSLRQTQPFQCTLGAGDAIL